ncbi:MAG TPA: hypothetical protein RMH99_16080 [Sandaracinaceae bacterium LLY-WYZ-13_1]|nr:hypothetical protein [Sandaracinaceae bacterium LLY-WYZ-13_1]
MHISPLIREPHRQIDVAVAPRSRSNFFESLDGTTGVFWATYQRVPAGTRLRVVLHLPGGLELERRAVAAFRRDDVSDGWPGVGLTFPDPDATLLDCMRRFERERAPMYVPQRLARAG